MCFPHKEDQAGSTPALASMNLHIALVAFWVWGGLTVGNFIWALLARTGMPVHEQFGPAFERSFFQLIACLILAYVLSRTTS